MIDDEIISVVQAHKEGKKIQSRLLDKQELGWLDLPIEGPIYWNFSQVDYRVALEPPATAGKLQPREWSVHVRRDGMITSFPMDQGTIEETIRVREMIVPNRDQRTWWAELPLDGSVGQIFTNSRQLTKGGRLIRVMEVLEW